MYTAMLCVAALLACLGSAARCGAAPPGSGAAADAALAEALAYFGADPGPSPHAGWRLQRLEAALEGAGFHRRRRYEVVLRHHGACEGTANPGSQCAPGSSWCGGASEVRSDEGPAPAVLERPDAASGRERCGGASDLGLGHALEQIWQEDAPLGDERGSEGVACEAAILQVAASTLSRLCFITCMKRTSGRKRRDCITALVQHRQLKIALAKAACFSHEVQSRGR